MQHRVTNRWKVVDQIATDEGGPYAGWSYPYKWTPRHRVELALACGHYIKVTPDQASYVDFSAMVDCLQCERGEPDAAV